MIRALSRGRLTLTALVALTLAGSRPAAMPRFSEWSAPINLGPVVNSAFNETGPALSKNGRSLYFTSNREGGLGGQDIWVSRRASDDDAEWGEPENLGPAVNTPNIDRNPAFSRDGHLLFFASDRLNGFGLSDIWVSYRAHTRDDFAWQPAENIGSGINTAANEAGPTYFENDDVGVPQLFFTSIRPGGLGGADIYRADLGQDGTFGSVQRVHELSTAFGEARPQIRRDGLEIFFHSVRPGSRLFPCPFPVTGDQGPGIVCFDLWVSERTSVLDLWQTPLNLGTTINSVSADMDATISSDGETLIFTSNRPGGFGGLDLYMSTRTKLSKQGDK